MKKILILFMTLNTLIVFSQEIKNKNSKILSERKHEIKIGAIKLLAGPIFEGTYEYIYSKDFTFGSSVLVDLQNENAWDENLSLTPFARFYFQESKEYGAKGFFVEGFAKLAIGKNELYKEIYSNYDSEKFTTGALGLSLGKKWINHSGFVFESLIGFGRSIGNTNNAPDVFIRGDLSIGYRF
jgi:hypothetical protein